MDALDKMLYEIGEEEVLPSKALINRVKYEVNQQPKSSFELVMLVIASCLSGVSVMLLLWLLPVPNYAKFMMVVMLWLSTIFLQVSIVVKKDLIIQWIDELSV